MISVVRGARKAAGQVLRAAPLHVAPLALWRKLLPKTDLGICYHLVSDGPVRHLRHYRFLDTEAFESDLNYLDGRFEFVTYEELARRRSSMTLKRRDSLILTFDDGFAQCATVVAPLLRRRGVRCVFFVVTDLIDNQVLFRESAASLCIESILQMPFDQVESIMTELGRVAAQSTSLRLFQDSFNPDSFGLYARLGYAVADVAPYLLTEKLIPPASAGPALFSFRSAVSSP